MLGGLSDLIGTKEAADLLNISQNRVRQLVASHQLPAERIGRTIVLRRTDIESFAASPPGRPRHPRRAT